MKVEPYLNYDGRCEEAIEFYKKAAGAEVTMLMRFKDAPPDAQCAPASADKVMHSSLRIGESTIMLSDGHCQGKGKFEGISLSITTPTAADATKVFDALGQGGTVTMPLTKTFFSPSFGMLNDKFGVTWMIMAEK